MKIKVKVITSSSQERIEYLGPDDITKVWTHSRPIKGEATKRVREILADYLKLPKHKVVLVSGKTSNIKTYKIESY